MTYKKFLEIVAGHKKRPDWVSGQPITIGQNKGRHIILWDNKAMLSIDIGSGPEEINISPDKVDPQWAVKEVFERFNEGINR